ncbi:hypothetical protein THAOC_04283 [Thalassiosira oceanica]|uniref:Uncharacterized protein n=1 Tax=Thalassiosira oceanica TaxID=159749 RepID=K0TP19_THAOC|nr:hypothetical protein THAOC_04283 [Thalassiosira oceanica]|eukprot:EJK74062.1 hypothetical protein THAOC_04283 [Thalassiosira oceanica]
MSVPFISSPAHYWPHQYQGGSMPVLARALVITVASSVIAPAESFCATMASSSPSSFRRLIGRLPVTGVRPDERDGQGEPRRDLPERLRRGGLPALPGRDLRGRRGLQLPRPRGRVGVETRGGRELQALARTGRRLDRGGPDAQGLQDTLPSVLEPEGARGWAAESEGEPEPLLDALGLRESVSAEAREASGSWRTVSTERELLSCLRRCREVGGSSGYLPGLYEFIVPGPGRLDLSRSLDDGLVFVLDCPDVDKEQSSCSSPEGQVGPALLAFTRDGRISSLKSNWVCSVVASSRVSFESAIDYAHSSDVADKLNTGTARKNTPPFCLVFDDRVPIEEGTLAERLPRVEDECVVFSYIQKKE